MTKMNIRKILLWTLAAGLCAGAFSCKKDSEEDTRITLRGTLTFSIPPYVAPGEVFELVPSVIKKQDGGTPGIYWAFSFIPSIRDTTRYENGTGDGAIILEVPDTLTSLTVTCAAFAEGYYNTTGSSTVAVVHGQETLSGLGLPDDVSVFEDPRDGRLYPYVEIGGLEWFTRNLACDGGAFYRDAAAMQDVFGQYYSWEEASQSCPDGWRLPDAQDWAALVAAAGGTETEDGICPGISGSLMADAYMAEKKMWEFFPEVKITNNLLFCALPTGYAVDAQGTHVFYGLSEYSVFWTAEEAEDEDYAYCRNLYVASPDVFKSAMHKETFLAPVRCVRDVE